MSARLGHFNPVQTEASALKQTLTVGCFEGWKTASLHLQWPRMPDEGWGTKSSPTPVLPSIQFACSAISRNFSGVSYAGGLGVPGMQVAHASQWTACMGYPRSFGLSPATRP
jgi:hypothetical protein